MHKLDVINMNGEKIDEVRLNKEIFDGKINQTCIKQVILMYQANKRQGTASTKTQADVSGGGRKPWKQKGTGRARAGSIRSGLWRGGGTTFGPKPRDYSYKLPKKMRKIALKSSLNAKLKSKKILLLDELVLTNHKTRQLHLFLKNINKQDEKNLLILEEIEQKVKLASQNIKNLSLKRINEINTLDILLAKSLIFTKSALERLPQRLK